MARTVEKQTPHQVVYANAAYGAGVTTIVVTTGTDAGTSITDLVIFKPGHVIQDQITNEQMLVTAFDGVNTLTVSRGFGTTAAAAIAANDPILIVGSAYAEGSGYATSVAYQPTAPSNNCQIFKTSFSLSRTALKTYLRSGDHIGPLH